MPICITQIISVFIIYLAKGQRHKKQKQYRGGGVRTGGNRTGYAYGYSTDSFGGSHNQWHHGTMDTYHSGGDSHCHSSSHNDGWDSGGGGGGCDSGGGGGGCDSGGGGGGCGGGGCD